MLSVCIPVYNFDVQTLVETLHQQLEKLAIPYEIIINDDNSRPEFKLYYQHLDKLSNVKIIEQSQNLGRAKNRNDMSKRANYEYLLFIDADAKVVTNDFVLKYIEQCPHKGVVCGTMAYEKNQSKNFRRWYGLCREMKTAAERSKNPYLALNTFNVMFHQSVFKQIQFDESLQLYGHEDTLMGFQLKKLNFPIVHIDNPLIHNNLEENSIFLKKTEMAIQNLVQIHQSLNYDFEFAQDVKLLKTFYRCKQLKINGLIAFCFRATKKLLSHYLMRTQPSLFWFDVYKLGYLCSIWH